MTIYYATGESVTLSSTEVTPGSTYIWEKDGVVIPTETAKDLVIASFAVGNVGDYKVTADNAGTPTENTFELGLVSMVLTPPTTQILSIEEGNSFGATMVATLSYNPTATPTEQLDYTLTSQWTKDGSPISGATSLTYSKTGVVIADTGVYAISNRIQRLSVNIGSASVSTLINLTVTANVLESKWYVVPLDYRDTSFTWIGYWVLDEIRSNSDWFTNYQTLKYKDEIETIVKAFNDYGEVELMESRNGRILKVSDLK